MPISFGLTSNLSIDQNLSVGGTAAIGSSLTLTSTTASSLLYGNASKVVSSVVLASNLSLTTGTLALATALTSINSVTAESGTALTLSGGSSGATLFLGAGTTHPYLQLRSGGRFALNAVASNDAYIEYVGNAGTSGTTSVAIGQSAAGLGIIYNRSNAGLIFGTNSLERGRFTETGNLLVGTTTDISGSGNLAVAGGTVTAGAAATNLTLSGGSSGASLVLGSGAGTALVTVPGAFLNVYRPSSALSASSVLALELQDSAANRTTYGYLSGTIATNTDASESGHLDFGTMRAGTLTQAARLASTGNLLIGTTTDMSGVAGGVKIAATNASTGVGFGALQVAGGIYAGAASVFGSTVATSGAVTVGNTTGGGGLTVTSTAENRVVLRSFQDSPVGILFQSNTQATGHYNWLVGSQQLTNQAFEIVPSTAINGTTFTTAAMRIDGATSAATFAGAVTGNSTFSSGVLSTTAGGYKLFDAGGYAVNFRPTAARTYVIEGDSSGNDYLTSFTNAGAGKHNLAASGTLSITGAATFAGAVTANGQLIGKGTATNDNAATGYIGEYVSSAVAGSAVSLTTATAATVTSISLTAGDWDVFGNVEYALTGATTTQFTLSPSLTTNTLSANTGEQAKYPAVLTTTSDNFLFPITTSRVSVASTTTLYLVARATFSAGSITAGGTIKARRVR